MAISRAQKEQDVDTLRQALAATPHAILVDFKGLDVAGATDLRRKLRDEEASFRVVKNTVALLAVEDTALETLNESFVGQTAIVFTHGDVVSLAKTLSDFAKDFETPSFKAGIVDGAAITVEEFDQLAKLPSRDDLIAQALYLMNYPIAGLATALAGILRQAVTVLDQIREQKAEAGDPTGNVEPAAAEAPAEEADGAVEAEAAAADEPATPAEAAPEAAADEAPSEDESDTDEAAAKQTPADAEEE